MATMESISGIEDWLVQKIISEQQSYEHVSKELQEIYPNLRGLSSRSIRRFCENNGIHATSRLTDSQLDRVVASSAFKVSTADHECPFPIVYSVYTSSVVDKQFPSLEMD